MKISQVNTYRVTKAIAEGLKSQILAGNEISNVFVYANNNFNVPLKLYANMAIGKEKFPPLSIVVNEIGSSYLSAGKETNLDTLAVEVQIKIPQSPIREVETNGFVEYENYFKLSEFAEIIFQQILDKTKTTICYNLKQAMFRPDEIELTSGAYTGIIELTYEHPIY